MAVRDGTEIARVGARSWWRSWTRGGSRASKIRGGASIAAIRAEKDESTGQNEAGHHRPARGTRSDGAKTSDCVGGNEALCSGEGWWCVPLLVVPQALGDFLRHAAPQLTVVTLYPRVGTQRLEQRDQRAARAVLLVSHGNVAKESVSSPALFPRSRSHARRRGRTPVVNAIRARSLASTRECGTRGSGRGSRSTDDDATKVHRRVRYTSPPTLCRTF